MDPGPARFAVEERFAGVTTCSGVPQWSLVELTSSSAQTSAGDTKGLVAFMGHVFCAEGTYAAAAPTIVTIGDSKIMISDAGGREPGGSLRYGYVRDADLTFRRALDCGAAAIEKPFDMPYGDRRRVVIGPWGNIWQIAVCRATEDLISVEVQLVIPAITGGAF